VFFPKDNKFVTTGSQVEVGCVEDERVDKEILDDGGGPDKERTMRTRTRFWRKTTGRDRRRRRINVRFRRTMLMSLIFFIFSTGS
jgi:hypothetical protein